MLCPSSLKRINHLTSCGGNILYLFFHICSLVYYASGLLDSQWLDWLIKLRLVLYPLLLGWIVTSRWLYVLNFKPVYRPEKLFINPALTGWLCVCLMCDWRLWRNFPKILCRLQVSVRWPPPSVVSRSARPTLSPWRHTWPRRWMVSTLNFARPYARTLPALKGRPRPVGETWSSTRLCWASLTLWSRGIVPGMARRPPHIPRSSTSPATTAAAPNMHTPMGTRTCIHMATATPSLVTCSVACSETLTWGHLRTASRPARWKGRGLLLIMTICRSRSPMSPWSLVPVLQQLIRWVKF